MLARGQRWVWFGCMERWGGCLMGKETTAELHPSRWDSYVVNTARMQAARKASDAAAKAPSAEEVAKLARARVKEARSQVAALLAAQPPGALKACL